MKKKFNFLFLIIIKFIIFTISVYLIYIKLNQPPYNIAFYLSKINYSIFFLISVISLIFILSQMYVHYYVTSISIKKKINFTYFSKLFFNSQILNVIVPHIGTFYRAFFLKKINLKYMTFININIYFFWFSFFFYFFFYSIEILLFTDNIKFYNFYLFSLLLLISIFVYLLPFIKINFFISKFKILNKVFVLYQKNIVYFLKNCLKKTFIFMILFNSFLHILNFLIIFLLIKNITISDITFGSIVIFFIFNSIIDQFPITPKNFGLGELFMGYSATSLGLPFEFGVALKLLIRFFYFINLSLIVFYFNLRELPSQ